MGVGLIKTKKYHFFYKIFTECGELHVGHLLKFGEIWPMGSRVQGV